MTFKDLSEQIGVSTATISRVLTGRGYVKDETKKMVEDALQASGYTYAGRKRSASSMKNTVLVITGDLYSAVFASYIRGISSAVEASGKNVLIYYSNFQTDKEEAYLRIAGEEGFLGVVMLNAVETSTIVELINTLDCPVVMVNRHLSSVNTDVVAINNLRGGFIGTDYLIKHGHTRIAHLAGAKNSSTSQERLNGYRDAMNMASLPIAENAIYYGDLNYSGGYAFGEMLCAMPAEERFTAVYSANAPMTMGMLDALFNGGLSVPEDISVVCMDNSSTLENGRVKITVVDYDPEKMGVAAGELLLYRIAYPESEKRQVIYPPELIERNSVRKLS